MIDRARGGEEVLAGRVLQQVHRKTELVGVVPGVVDDGIPAAAFERAEVAVPVPDKPFHFGEEVDVGLAAVEDGDLVPPGHRAPHDVRADESGAAQNQDSHRLATAFAGIRHSRATRRTRRADRPRPARHSQGRCSRQGPRSLNEVSPCSHCSSLLAVGMCNRPSFAYCIPARRGWIHLQNARCPPPEQADPCLEKTVYQIRKRRPPVRHWPVRHRTVRHRVRPCGPGRHRRPGRRRRLRARDLGAPLPHHRPDHHGRARRGAGGRRVGPQHLLRRRRYRRPLEDRERRDNLRARLQGRGHRVGRRRGRGALEPQRGLGGNRGAEQPPEFAVGQRRVPLRRRRAYLDACGAGEHAPCRSHPGAPDGPRRGLRGRGRPSVGVEPGTGRLPHQRRGRDLGAGPVRGRAHRRHRSGNGPDRPEDAVRSDVPAAAAGVGVQWRRPRERDLPHHGRRRQLDGAHQRPSGRGQGAHRAGHLPGRHRHDLRAGGGGRARAGRFWRRRVRRLRRRRGRPPAPEWRLPLDRPGRDMGTDQHHQQSPHVLQPESGSTPTTPNGSTWAARRSTARRMAETISPPTPRPRSTSTTTRCGSIQPTPST